LPEVELCVEQGLASGGRGERHAATSYVTTARSLCWLWWDRIIRCLVI
jgi:hypothetical protein